MKKTFKLFRDYMYTCPKCENRNLIESWQDKQCWICGYNPKEEKPKR